MRRNTTEGLAHRPVRFRRLLLRLGIGVGVLLALFILFEVGIRHVPPDGMTVTFISQEGVPLGIGPWTYTAPTDQPAIDHLYTALNTATVHSQVTERVWLYSGCYRTAYPQVTFTWHGIPIQSWSSLDSIHICEYIENAGGLSENLTRTYHLWFPAPFQRMPPPAPR